MWTTVERTQRVGYVRTCWRLWGQEAMATTAGSDGTRTDMTSAQSRRGRGRVKEWDYAERLGATGLITYQTRTRSVSVPRRSHGRQDIVYGPIRHAREA